MQWMLQKGVKVINLSLGVPGYTPFFEAVMRRLRADGVLVVCAIGNEGPHTCRSPGNYEQVVSVGAAADAKRVAAFSGSITFRDYVRPFAPDVLAPGEGIVSALAGGGLVRMDGTSMATALVTGLAALLKQADRDASPQRIEGAMKLSCQRLDGEAIWRQGFGLIDGERAYQAMQ
jgi:subtilisin family serine protease